MSKLLRLSIAIAFFALELPYANGQAVHVERLISDEISDFIYDIDQAPSGVIFMATDEGLVTFDGRSYNKIDENDGLLEDFVSGVEVYDDLVIFQYFEQGISILPITAAVEEIKYDLTAERILDIYKAADGVYCITEKGDVYGLNTESLEFEFQFKSKVSRPSQIAMHGENIVVASDSSLNFYQKDGNPVKQIHLEDRVAKMVLDDRKDRLYAITVDGVINSFNTDPTILGGMRIQSNAQNVMDMTVSNDGSRLFISTRSDGFYTYVISTDQNVPHTFLEHLQERNGLATNSIKVLFMDAHGNLWIGGYGEGASMLSSLDHRSLSFDAQIYSMTSNEHSVYATTGNTLYQVNPVSLGLVHSIELPGNVYFRHIRMYEDDLIGVTDDNKVKYFDLDREEFEFDIDLGDWDPIRINGLEIINSEVVILSEAGVGLYHLQEETFKVLNIGSGLPSNRVLAAAMNHRNGNILIGLDGGGLVEIGEGYEIAMKDPDVNNYRINALLKTESFDCFTTIGEGLYFHNGEEYVQMNGRRNMPELESFLLNIDASDDSLLTTLSSDVLRVLRRDESGTFQVDRTFHEIDASSKDFIVRDGKCTYVSNQALRTIKLVNDENRSIKFFPLAITTFRVDGNKVSQSNLKPLDPGIHRIRFNFMSPDFTDGQEHQYEFKLEGYEEFWNRTEQGVTNAYYPNLNSGEYNFRVRIVGAPQSEISQTFVINTPLWQRTWFQIVAGITLLVVLIVILWVREKYHNTLRSYLTYQIKKHTNQIREQSLEIEHQNQEILDSIEYAKRIQKAILPRLETFEECLDEPFVFYLPKDIVAGDFYWLHHHDNMVYYAAADCTGHGVPGAMVSVVCHNALDQSVKEFGQTQPSKILDTTADIVDATFAKSLDDVKDGMDVSLCALNNDTKTITWAGAHNPIWIVTKRLLPDLGEPSITEGDTHLFEIKADKQPIGKYLNRTPYTHHELQLEKGDTYYLFTDGFPDQFGGPKGRKFMYKRLKKLLIEMYPQSLSQQMESLKETMDTWKGDLEQVDDVLIIGNRIH